MNTDSLVFDRYRIIGVIGSGGMGSVFLAEDIESGVRRAVKETDLVEFNQKEAVILQGLNHPALPKVYEYGENDGKFCMVMDYITGDTLDSIISSGIKYDEERFVSWYMQFCDILKYLHGLNPPIAYRDFKPSNIIISEDGRVKLIDFGIAEEYSPEHIHDKKYTALTRGYAAPEQYTLSYDVDVRTDIYALGATMHYLVTGKNPQIPPYKFVATRRINRASSRALEAIIEKSLQPEPEKRYQTADELLQALIGRHELDQKLIKKEKRKQIIAAVASIAVLFAAVVAFLLAGSIQSKLKGKHDQYIEAATEAVNLGDYDRAKEILEQAIEEEPNMEDAYLENARVYLLEGDTELFYQYLDFSVLPRFPEIINNEDYQELLEEAEDLKGNN